MAVYRLAAIIERCQNTNEVLLVRQTTPPNLPEEEYSNYVDSHLWDLPSAPLNPLQEQQSPSSTVIAGADSHAYNLNLRMFDVDSALNQVLLQVGTEGLDVECWVLWKYVEEAEFGPEPLIHTVYMRGKLKVEEERQQEVSKWISIQRSLELLVEVRVGNDRLGPMVVTGLLTDSADSRKWKVPNTLRFQAFLGVPCLIKPYHTW